MGGIIIAGTELVVDPPIRNWHETGWDATIEKCVQSETPCPSGGVLPFGTTTNNRPQRYAVRPQLAEHGMHPPLDAVKGLLDKLVFHHDGCANSAMCWQVLHNERGLSCHFLVDNDGTIYQTIDLALMAFHAAQYNVRSVGIEISNRGEAAKDRDYYAKRHQPRDITYCTVNGSKIETFAFTDAQMVSMRALCLALQRLLPNIPIEYPQSAPGQQSWETLRRPDGREGGATDFKGFLGHYHCTDRKWDPGPFDFKAFCEQLRGRRCFPLWTGAAPPTDGERPFVPDDDGQRRGALAALYAMNEQKSDGGFFPVGPWGEHRLWHGGVHLAADDRAAIWSPFAGRVVAARMGRSSPYGSVCFVLVRHDMTVGDVAMRFFALYMHVHDESAEADPPAWMTKDGWRTAARDGAVEVALLDEPVEAGEVIARVGRAGPDDVPQIHLEIFSEDEILPRFPGARVDPYDGSGGGRFVDDKDIVSKIDVDPKDGRLSRRELLSFFRARGERDNFHALQVRFTSEWTADPDWSESLKAATDFRDVKPDEIDALVAAQITPSLWWTDAVADHCKIPFDGLVYHYHPIDFLGFLNEKIQEARPAKRDPNAPVTGPAPGVTDDNEGDTGASSIADGQNRPGDRYGELRLEDFAQGFDGDRVTDR